jgi:hypothetical protein
MCPVYTVEGEEEFDQTEIDEKLSANSEQKPSTAGGRRQFEGGLCR